MKRLLGLVAVTLLAACGGGAHNPLPSTPASTAAKERVTIKIDVPKNGNAATRTPQYVSQATTQMVVNVQTGCPGNCVSVSGYPTTAALTPTSGGCTSTLANTFCQLSLSLAPGNYTVTLTAQDASNTVLSAAHSIPFTVLAGTNNVLSLTLGGIPTSVVLVPNAASALSGNNASGYTLSNCESPQNVSVLATDADGNYILGPGAPSVSLTSSSGNVLITDAGSAAPNAFSLNCLAVNGVPTPLTATVIPAAASGATTLTANVSLTPFHSIAGTVSEFSVPTGAANPTGIAAGPDGALWFTENGGNKIGRITTTGTLTEFSTGITANAGLQGITAGPDGALWFAESNISRIGRITTTGTVTEFSTITTNAAPESIITGPDGALWFIESSSASKIGRITTTGTVTEFSTGITANALSFGITAGPDGTLWFTEPGVNKIGRITTTGTVTEFSTGITANAAPTGITAGPDGALWFTENSANKIGRITTTGTVTEFSTITANALPLGITAGPDGALWFTESSSANKIGRITTTGTVTEFSTGITANAAPFGITAGPDGALWFTEFGTGKIGQVQ